jgi:hypothetical protein
MDSALLPALATAVGAVVGAAASYAAASRQSRTALQQTRVQYEKQMEAEDQRERRARLQSAYQVLAEWLHLLEDSVRRIDALLRDGEDDQALDELRSQGEHLRTTLATPPQTAALAECLWREDVVALVARLGPACTEYAEDAMRRMARGPQNPGEAGVAGSGTVFGLSNDIRILIREELLGRAAAPT